MSRSFFPRRFSARVITTLMLVVLLTAIIVGLPAIWMLRNQLDRQAWAQVKQGQHAAVALYAARYRELQNLAVLTAQRPTLQELLLQGNQAELFAYLQTLKEGAGLTRIVVCDSSAAILVATDESVPVTACIEWKRSQYQYDPDLLRAFLTAHQVIRIEAQELGEVFVCEHLDTAFVSEISAETGLEHTIWKNDTLVSTSIVSGEILLNREQTIQAQINETLSSFAFEIDGDRYYAARIPLDEAGLSAEVALNVSEIFSVQTQMALWMIAAILGVTLTVSVIGIGLSRQISRPLEKLASSAEAFQLGNLNEPVETDLHILEIAQVAQALEGARTDLRQTLITLQSERDWGEHLLASIVEGIITLDGQGCITFFSHGAERITGWSRAEVLGRAYGDVFHLLGGGESLSKVIPESGERAKIDVLLAGGKEASLAITRAALMPTNAAGAEVALVFRDVSEEEAVHRLLGHFLANVAHEFRTPLTALAASIELLLDQAPELNQVELNELLLSLHLGALGLQTLVDNLLESASMEVGHFRISPRVTDLGNIIADSTNTMKPLLEKYGQRLVLELPVDIPVVRADPRRMVQVLVNLIGNASKYGPSDAEIKLKVTRSSCETRVEIADRGLGIPLEARENLFRRFVYPSKESTMSQPGAGLGLSVVKTIIKAHGGDVGVDDNPCGGSIFWFTLPIVEDGS